MNRFISCDWGTSAFRLRLIVAETQVILAEVKTSQGIAATHELFKNSGLDRFCFYYSVISNNLKTLEQHAGYKLDGTTIVISGMASSGIGMIELPYSELPVKTDGSDLLIRVVETSDQIRYRMIIISGVRSLTDVMRGEETMLAGCNIKKDDKEQLYIFPGTHCKHVIVKNGSVTGFKTYMTGELFDLLSAKSILSSSVLKDDDTADHKNSFEKGVIEGKSANLLTSIFQVRTNQLFNKLAPAQNYHYLSGLLIGTELKDLPAKNYPSVMLVSDEKIAGKYLYALAIIGTNNNVKNIDADEALIKGQCAIYNQSLTQSS